MQYWYTNEKRRHDRTNSPMWKSGLKQWYTSGKEEKYHPQDNQESNYRLQRSCGKVMFLHPCVILFTGGLCLGGSLSRGRGVSVGGSLLRGPSVQGVKLYEAEPCIDDQLHDEDSRFPKIDHSRSTPRIVLKQNTFTDFPTGSGCLPCALLEICKYQGKFSNVDRLPLIWYIIVLYHFCVKCIGHLCMLQNTLFYRPR